MGKGTVDFGAFSPEDLVAAQWAQLDVLVTDELRSRPRPFERSIVAVVNRRVYPAGSSGGSIRAALANTTLCHQGHGGDDSRALSDTLTEYLESLLTERSCDPTLSLAEDRVRALAGYFARACIAGPWLPDGPRDAELKAKYPSLCAACGSRQCHAGDRYWGVTGALACLAEGAGDVTWAHLDDVEAFFGLTGAAAFSPPEQFSLLCRDGSLQPLGAGAGAAEPCAWLHVPWPVIVAKRKASAAVSDLARSLASDNVTADAHWRGALAALLDVNRPVEPLAPARVPLDHLATAPGFREAYSRTGCSPPRHVTICTTSLLEKNKCEWLSEAAAVHGAAPPLQCALRPRTTDCLAAVEAGDCDVTLADSDWLVRAQRDYAVAPILHETTPIIDQTSTVVAYVKQSAMLDSLNSLRGQRASFPRFDGFAWHAVSQYLAKKEGKPCNRIIQEYFGDICAPGVQGNYSEATVERLTRGCVKEGGMVPEGELQALRALVEDRSDVAFVSLATFHRYSEGKLVHEPWAKEVTKLVPLCPEKNQMYCFLGWSTLGHVYAAKNISSMRRQEIINVFEKADQLFGKKIPFRNAMFSLYGPFNHQADVLFHNNTKSLATAAILFTHPYDKIPMNFERSLTADSCQLTTFVTDLAVHARPSMGLAMVSLVLFVLGR